MRKAAKIVLTDSERTELNGWLRAPTAEVRRVLRARIVLLAAQGWQNKDIADEVNANPNTVVRWRARFAANRLAGIVQNRPRQSDRRRVNRNLLAQKIVEATTQTRPPNATHWSTRSLAAHLKVSVTRVYNAWKAANLQPHRSRVFKVSRDPKFVEKTIDVVGLYINPPENAIVLSVDEKTQIQALDRRQKSLPMYPGRCGTLTHDYYRHGTTTLFAAMNVLDGTVIGTCMDQHRHQEWIAFLKKIDCQTPRTKELHLIVDNYSAHKHANVEAWLKKHPRFHIHYTPTSSSWLNMVERWFRELTQKRIRRDSFRSVQQVIDAIMLFIENHNRNAEPYLWKAKAEDIIVKWRRARATLEKLQ